MKRNFFDFFVDIHVCLQEEYYFSNSKNILRTIFYPHFYTVLKQNTDLQGFTCFLCLCAWTIQWFFLLLQYYDVSLKTFSRKTDHEKR